MNVKELIRKLQDLPESTNVLVENQNTGTAVSLTGFERGRFSPFQKEFIPLNDAEVEESNAILLI